MNELNSSGNYLVDQWEELQNEISRSKDILECGCRKYCKCDSDWDERDDD